MTTPTPLPCPFCGSAARLESFSCESWMVKHGGDPSPRYFVECWGRGCRAHLWLADSKADAVAAWNKAPREAQPGALQAAAIEAVGLLTGASHHRMRGYNLCSACEERWPCDVEEARRLISAVLGDQ